MKSTAEKNIIKIVNQLTVPENRQQVSYWKINSTLFNNPRIKQDSRGIKKNILNGIKVKIQHQTLWDTVKAALRGKFLALNAYIRKEKMSHINNLSTYLKNLEKEAK